MTCLVEEGRLLEFDSKQNADFGDISSCIAIIIECDGGSVIAGHCVLCPEANQKDFDTIMQEINTKVIGKTIKAAHLIGAVDFWESQKIDCIKSSFPHVSEINTSNYQAIQLTFSEKGAHIETK